TEIIPDGDREKLSIQKAKMQQQQQEESPKEHKNTTKIKTTLRDLKGIIGGTEKTKELMSYVMQNRERFGIDSNGQIISGKNRALGLQGEPGTNYKDLINFLSGEKE